MRLAARKPAVARTGTWRWLETRSASKMQWHNGDVSEGHRVVIEAACFHVCPCSNNVLSFSPTITVMVWSPFNRLFSVPVQCERSLLHSKLVHGGPAWAQLGDEGFHSYQDWEQTVAPLPLSDTGAYCARSRPCRSVLVATHGEQIWSLFLTAGGLDAEFRTGNIRDEDRDKHYSLLYSEYRADVANTAERTHAGALSFSSSSKYFQIILVS